jgi:hypothetical protein
MTTKKWTRKSRKSAVRARRHVDRTVDGAVELQLNPDRQRRAWRPIPT